jgi:integrase
MTVIDFKDSVIRALDPPPLGGDRQDYRFRQRSGLTLRSQPRTRRHPNGRKVFYVTYRFGPKQEVVRLMPDFPELGCSGATKQWQKIMADAVLGTNAAQTRRDRRIEKPKAQPKTMGVVLGEYKRTILDGLSVNHSRNTRRLIERYIEPRWGKFALDQITRDDVRALVQEIIDSGKESMARSVQATLVAFFNWAAHEAQYLAASPLQGLKRRVKEMRRERTLTDDELVAVLGGARHLPYPYGSFVLTLAGLGQRRTEVAKMRSTDIGGGVWVIPGTDSKNRKSHRLVLPPFVLAVLDDARREVENNIRRYCGETGRPAPEVIAGFDYLFSGRYRASLNSFSQCKSSLDAAVEAFCAEIGLPVPAPWRLHDLRRTCGSVLARLGVPSATIGRLMNHTQPGVTSKVYITHSYEREIGDALRVWSDHLARLEKRGRTTIQNVA